MRSLGLRMAASLLASIFACPPAKAQSLFEALFGFQSAKPAAETSRRPKIRAGVRLSPRLQPYSVWAAERLQSTLADGEDYIRDPAYGGIWRTVCVRTCDGYYWPVSRSVTRDRFEADARKCEAGCAGEARLYYSHRDSDDPATMIDLDGKPYGELKTAFLYRKTLRSGCGCRPAPWSVAERVRHDRYKADADALKLARAMQDERERAEQMRQDKIAQMIAASAAAAELDEAEAVSAGDAVAAVEIDTDPEVSVTGYVHLHVLPSDAVEIALIETEPATDPAVSVSDLELAFAEISAHSQLGTTVEARRKKPRPARVVRAKTQSPVQTVSLFSPFSGLLWPGDPPRRQR